VTAPWITEVESHSSIRPAEVRPDLSATPRIVTDTRKQALAIPIIALDGAREHADLDEQRPRAERRGRHTARHEPSWRAGANKKETEGVSSSTAVWRRSMP